MSDSLFDPETGEVFEPDPRHTEKCPRCEQAMQERLQAEMDLRAAEAELRRARRVVQNLTNELERQRREAPEGRMARALGKYWIAACEKDPKRTKLGEKRLKAVIARIRDGYEPEYIARAIDGIAACAYVDPATGKRYDDLELVCRDETKLERFYELAERTGAPTLVGPAWKREWSTPEADVTNDPEPEAF